jgi:patatin-related protein
MTQLIQTVTVNPLDRAASAAELGALWIALRRRLQWVLTRGAGMAEYADARSQSSESSSEPFREVRIALVCYGGVSLAIYMHGVTRELHRLVAASSRFDADQNPFDPRCTEHVYWELLQHLAARDRVRTQVVVDVISGTSAGGINGVFLAKAIAHDLSQQSLRDLWFAEADIGKLLSGPSWLSPRGKLAWFAIRALARRLRVAPPLRGDQMSRLLHRALSAMDEDGATHAAQGDRPAAPRSLLPEGMSLELFVTATDARGHRRYLPISNRVADGDRHLVISDLTHRHVLQFHLDQRHGKDHFAGPANNLALAFSARATSCFPGAFPPVSLAEFAHQVGAENPNDLTQVEREFFRAYQLAQEGPRNTFFIDGGVLDNFPFGHAIDAITSKPAASEVKRRLVYIEPDPSLAGSRPPPTPPERPSATAPQWVETIVAGLSTIPSKEPIVDELQRLRTFNEQVAYISDLAATNYPAIREALHDADRDLRQGGDLTQTNVGQVNAAMHQAARQRLDSGYRSYVRLKLQRVMDDVAELVARTWAYPPESGQASFVRTAMLALLERKFPAAEAGEVITPPVMAFLKSFDLAFTERRLRFVIQGVNAGYGGAAANAGGGAPLIGPLDDARRKQLDTVKRELYGFIEELWAAVSPATIQHQLGEEPFGLFSEDQLAEPLRREVEPQAFAEQHHQQLDALLDRLKEHMDATLGTFSGRLWTRFVEVTADWEQLQEFLLVRFLGFPIWDTLLLPIVELSGVRQFSQIQVVRISPRDGDPRLLPAKRLMGTATHHFGAFFSRKAREHDYLWGRLDGVEQLLGIVASGIDESWYRRAFEAVLEEEGPSLPSAAAVIQEVRGKVSTLPAVAEPVSTTTAAQ